MGMHQVYVMLSGGADSTTCLAIARKDFPNDPIETVSFNYGQRHNIEMEYAKYQAQEFNASHQIISLKGFMGGMLIDKGEDNEAIPQKSYDELGDGISPTYVSFRNGLMLSVLAARAQAWVMEQQKLQAVDSDATATLYCGVHADDGAHWAYPDCTPEFIGPMAAAIYTGTYNTVRVRAPLLFMDKAAVIREGTRLGVDYAKTWSCYVGADAEHTVGGVAAQCGKCPTCLSRRQAFLDNGIQDPTVYASTF